MGGDSRRGSVSLTLAILRHLSRKHVRDILREPGIHFYGSRSHPGGIFLTD